MVDGGTQVSDQSLDDLKKRVREYLATVNTAKNRDVAKALNEDKHLVDKAIGDLSKEGVIEYLYLNGSCIKLK
jgi:Mn-dependent DtxR family transcriptional regulator